MDIHLYCACRDTEAVSRLLGDPTVDVNFQHNVSYTPLKVASQFGHDQVVKLLLSHPDINVNWIDNQGHSAVWSAVFNDHWKVVELLLNFAATDIEIRDNLNRKLVYWASYFGSLKSLQVLLALRPVMVVEESDFNLGIDKNRNEVYDLFEAYQLNPISTRMQLWSQLGYTERFSAGLFALIIYVCDDYLRVRAGSNQVERFMLVCRRLPIELQMLLSNLAFGRTDSLVRSKHSKTAFCSLY